MCRNKSSFFYFTSINSATDDAEIFNNRHIFRNDINAVTKTDSIDITVKIIVIKLIER